MTNEQLAEIERLWIEATPGPWATCQATWGEEPHTRVVAEARVVTASGPACFIADTEREPDARAIAAAPEHVLSLVEEVRRLRAESSRWQSRALALEERIDRAVLKLKGDP